MKNIISVEAFTQQTGITVRAFGSYAALHLPESDHVLLVSSDPFEPHLPSVMPPDMGLDTKERLGILTKEEVNEALHGEPQRLAEYEVEQAEAAFLAAEIKLTQARDKACALRK